jgi:hypothetical protein
MGGIHTVAAALDLNSNGMISMITDLSALTGSFLFPGELLLIPKVPFHLS